MSKTLNIRLTDDISSRLDSLAAKTMLPKSFHIREILVWYLPEYEDAHFSLDRLNDRNAKYHSTKDVEKILDIEYPMHEDAIDVHTAGHHSKKFSK